MQITVAKSRISLLLIVFSCSPGGIREYYSVKSISDLI